jgi:two-component system NarL family response regulator
MKSRPPIRVVVVDDHPVVRGGLIRIINNEPGMTVVGEADNGADAAPVCEESKPEVVIMDLSMPKMGGMEAMAAVQRVHPDARFIIFSVYRGEEDIHRALHAGASGYLFKVVQPNELIAAIRKVAAGGRYLPLQVAESVRHRQPTDELSDRELEILSRIAIGEDDTTIGRGLGMGTGVVAAHISRLLDKLGAKDRAQAVVTAFERGIIHID